MAGPNGYGEIFGLEFYSGLYQLKGTPIGSNAIWAVGYESKNAVDDNDYTWWHGAAPGNTNFVGLNLDIPNYITQKNGSANITGSTTATTSGIWNYVAEKTYKQKSTSESETDITQVDINVTYLDGIGRPTHKIAVEASPEGRDIVQPIVYDNMGRSSTSYLPYTVNKNEGKSIDNPSGSSTTFYNLPPAGVTGDSKSTAYTEYEKSPIGRVLSQEIIGSHFTGKKTNLKYYLNQQAGDSPVNKYSYNGNYNPNDTNNLTSIANYSVYAANELAVNYVLYDGQESREYKDYEGRTILKRVRLDKPGTTWLDTYYVYDDLNQLRAVIPPKLTSLSYTELNNLAYLYHYDELGRPIVKKVPGKFAEFVVYDAWDRVAFTQDGKRRARNKWTYVNYDKLNRSVMTGQASCTSTRSVLQANVLTDTVTANRYVTKSGDYFTFGGAYGTSAVTYANSEILSVTYYDTYAGTTLPTGATFPAGAVSNPKGFAVGSRTRIFDPKATATVWNLAVTYYDTDYRPMQSFSSLYNIPSSPNAVEVVSTYYGNFHTRVMADSVVHKGFSTSNTLKLFNRYCYDHEGRLKKSFLTITKGAKTEKEIMVNKLTYNELGQLYKKEIHQKSGAGKTMQQLEYAYHLHGGLKSSTSKDFTQNLFYDTRKEWELNKVTF